jgi:hypothetical protein
LRNQVTMWTIVAVIDCEVFAFDETDASQFLVERNIKGRMARKRRRWALRCPRHWWPAPTR